MPSPLNQSDYISLVFYHAYVNQRYQKGFSFKCVMNVCFIFNWQRDTSQRVIDMMVKRERDRETVHDTFPYHQLAVLNENNRIYIQLSVWNSMATSDNETRFKWKKSSVNKLWMGKKSERHKKKCWMPLLLKCTFITISMCVCVEK